MRRGLEVSPCNLPPNHLLKGQVRNSPTQMVDFFLQPLEFLHLKLSYAAVLFAPVALRLFRNPNRLDRIKLRFPLTEKNFNQP